MSEVKEASPAAVAESRPAPESFSRGLAARVVKQHFRDLPADAIKWARVGILDTLGVTIAGSREPAALLAGKALDDNAGPCLVLGARRRTAALDAALINGAASHALDFDDCNNTLGGHPSAPVLSALLPLAEQLGSSGAEFVNAYVAGFEVECKTGMAVNLHHYTKGWHPTATLGVFGAAAACARLMNLDEDGVATALALAASFSSGLKANFGTMTKPLHVGHAARNGLYAARLAQQGYSANADGVFEHKHGFLEVFNGPGTYDTRKALAAWGAPLDIVEPGIAIKQYPCCGATHPAVDAMLDIVQQHRPRLEDVERIDAAVHSRRLAHTDRPYPQSELDAKFSLQYVMARALADGHIGLQDFENEAYREARIVPLLRRVYVGAYDETGAGGFPQDKHFGGYVAVTLHDGTVLKAQVEQPLGRTSANPLPPDRLRDKFTLCAQTVLRPDAVPAIAETIERVEKLDSMRAITSLIQAAAR
ncbi:MULTISPECIES: MmgE/PrpD family protein [unclassified Achromobacter]|uniref:MmgE/PrpD family protein n=1 Tax=unclassified Achromobacter TaxID=2626865 RepID=UPI0013032993|nr:MULTISPECIES: MmgE/PrpD family protein [unclassified Achromobacter]